MYFLTFFQYPQTISSCLFPLDFFSSSTESAFRTCLIIHVSSLFFSFLLSFYLKFDSNYTTFYIQTFLPKISIHIFFTVEREISMSYLMVSLNNPKHGVFVSLREALCKSKTPCRLWNCTNSYSRRNPLTCVSQP